MARVTSWAKVAINWCEKHPLPGILALSASVVIALFAIAQGVDWLVSKLNRPTPNIVDGEKETGGNFSVTVENPTDVAMVVTEAVLHAEPPPQVMNANFAELTIPAVTYTIPYDCSPGTKRIKLRPSFKVSAKEVGAVVFVSSRPMRDCQLYVSLKTSKGQTKEKEAISLAQWQRRAP